MRSCDKDRKYLFLSLLAGGASLFFLLSVVFALTRLAPPEDLNQWPELVAFDHGAWQSKRLRYRNYRFLLKTLPGWKVENIRDFLGRPDWENLDGDQNVSLLYDFGMWAFFVCNGCAYLAIEVSAKSGYVERVRLVYE